MQLLISKNFNQKMDEINHASNGQMAKKDNDRYISSIRYMIRCSLNKRVKKVAKTASNLNCRKGTNVEKSGEISENNWTENTSTLEEQKCSRVTHSNDGMMIVNTQESLMPKVDETQAGFLEYCNGNECSCTSENSLSYPDACLSFDQMIENNYLCMKKNNWSWKASKKNGILSRLLQLRTYLFDAKVSSLIHKSNWNKNEDDQSSFPISEVIIYGELDYSSLSSLDDESLSDCSSNYEAPLNFQEV